MNIKCKYDELVDPKSLKPFPKNRNKHTQDQIIRLAKLIHYQGQRAPIIVSNLSGCIVKGHGTRDAIIHNDWQKCAIVRQDFKDKDQEYAFVQSDNAIAEWAQLDLAGINEDIPELGPFDLDLLGIKNFKVDVSEIGQIDDDEVPEVKESFVKLGDLWRLGDHRLLCGDSTDIKQVERLMEGEKADMVFTDPPYLMSKSGGGLADKRPNWKKYQDNGLADFDPSDFISIMKIINPPTMYIFCSKDLLKAYINYFESCDRSWNLLVMAKNNPIPMKNNTFLSDTEWLLFSRGNDAYFNNFAPYEYYKKVFNISVKETEFGHPTEKQVKIIDRFIEISSNNGMLILDLFGGSGSTLIACEKTKRKCFMMEIDPHYCGVIIERWQQYTGLKAERITK